jgi:hypothetical protein
MAARCDTLEDLQNLQNGSRGLSGPRSEPSGNRLYYVPNILQIEVEV